MIMLTPTLSHAKTLIRANGYAWPGGYPAVLVMNDGEPLCAQCGRENWRQIVRATLDQDRHGWCLDSVEVHWEGDPWECVNCCRPIPSAYGPVGN